jgi:hypothetical protein
MNHTSAPTATPSPTTQKTGSTATATTASSGTVRRIDDFIKQKLSLANSADGFGISDSATRAAQLGFANSANARYASYLEAFRDSPRLTEKYREKYPNSLFLPWRALHQVKGTLKLWIDLTDHYIGAVPAEQLPWLEIFEFDPVDSIAPVDAPGLVGDARKDQRFRDILTAVAIMERDSYYGTPPQHDRLSYWENIDGADHYAEIHDADIVRGLRQNREIRRLLTHGWIQAKDQLFVVAPPDAFRTSEDWLERMRKIADKVAYVHKTPPNDPLVIRFCHGGALVVAAWGDEAAALNDITRELGI